MPNHFFSQNGLTACCTDTSITLFWDKPAAAGAVETYTVLLDDAAAAHTQDPLYIGESASGNDLFAVRSVAERQHWGIDYPDNTDQTLFGCDCISLFCCGRWKGHEYCRPAKSHRRLRRA